MSAFGQLASMFSGMGQAQAAPADQPVAQAYAQPAYAPAYTPVVAQNGSAPFAQSYRGIALSWNSGGAWVVRASPTLARASLDALRTCNNQFGECALADAVVAPTAFGCLVVAQSVDDTSRLFAAVGDTLYLARTSADAQVTNAGTHSTIVYTGCNG